jgi:hypothetical protein
VDTFEAAALKSITTFCEQHLEEVAAYPIGLSPAVFAHDAEWIYRTNHFGHLVGTLTEETLKTVIRYMNAQYRFQSLKQKCMEDMVNLAQDFHRSLILKDDQIHSLGQGIAGRDTTIGHIEMLQEQQMPPLVPNELEEEEEDSKEEPEEIEGVSKIDSEHGNPKTNPQFNHSSSGSHSSSCSQPSVGNLDYF